MQNCEHCCLKGDYCLIHKSTNCPWILYTLSIVKPPMPFSLNATTALDTVLMIMQRLQWTLIDLLALSFPVFYMLCNDRCTIFCSILPTNALHEITFWIHNIEIDAMIHQIVFFTRLNIWWCTEIDSILFADVLHLLPSSCETNQVWMELGEICSKNGRGIAEWVA